MLSSFLLLFVLCCCVLLSTSTFKTFAGVEAADVRANCGPLLKEISIIDIYQPDDAIIIDQEMENCKLNITNVTVGQILFKGSFAIRSSVIGIHKFTCPASTASSSRFLGLCILFATELTSIYQTVIEVTDSHLLIDNKAQPGRAGVKLINPQLVFIFIFPAFNGDVAFSNLASSKAFIIVRRCSMKLIGVEVETQPLATNSELSNSNTVLFMLLRLDGIFGTGAGGVSVSDSLLDLDINMFAHEVALVYFKSKVTQVANGIQVENSKVKLVNWRTGRMGPSNPGLFLFTSLLHFSNEVEKSGGILLVDRCDVYNQEGGFTLDAPKISRAVALVYSKKFSEISHFVISSCSLYSDMSETRGNAPLRFYLFYARLGLSQINGNFNMTNISFRIFGACTNNSIVASVFEIPPEAASPTSTNQYFQHSRSFIARDIRYSFSQLSDAPQIPLVVIASLFRFSGYIQDIYQLQITSLRALVRNVKASMSSNVLILDTSKVKNTELRNLKEGIVLGNIELIVKNLETTHEAYDADDATTTRVGFFRGVRLWTNCSAFAVSDSYMEAQVKVASFSNPVTQLNNGGGISISAISFSEGASRGVFGGMGGFIVNNVSLNKIDTWLGTRNIKVNGKQETLVTIFNIETLIGVPTIMMEQCSIVIVNACARQDYAKKLTTNVEATVLRAVNISAVTLLQIKSTSVRILENSNQAFCGPQAEQNNPYIISGYLLKVTKYFIDVGTMMPSTFAYCKIEVHSTNSVAGVATLMQVGDTASKFSLNVVMNSLRLTGRAGEGSQRLLEFKGQAGGINSFSVRKCDLFTNMTAHSTTSTYGIRPYFVTVAKELQGSTTSFTPTTFKLIQNTIVVTGATLRGKGLILVLFFGQVGQGESGNFASFEISDNVIEFIPYLPSSTFSSPSSSRYSTGSVIPDSRFVSGGKNRQCFLLYFADSLFGIPDFLVKNNSIVLHRDDGANLASPIVMMLNPRKHFLDIGTLRVESNTIRIHRYPDPRLYVSSNLVAASGNFMGRMQNVIVENNLIFVNGGGNDFQDSFSSRYSASSSSSSNPPLKITQQVNSFVRIFESASIAFTIGSVVFHNNTVTVVNFHDGGSIGGVAASYNTPCPTSLRVSIAFFNNATLIRNISLTDSVVVVKNCAVGGASQIVNLQVDRALRSVTYLTFTRVFYLVENFLLLGGLASPRTKYKNFCPTVLSSGENINATMFSAQHVFASLRLEEATGSKNVVASNEIAMNAEGARFKAMTSYPEDEGREEHKISLSEKFYAQPSIYFDNFTLLCFFKNVRKLSATLVSMLGSQKSQMFGLSEIKGKDSKLKVEVENDKDLVMKDGEGEKTEFGDYYVVGIHILPKVKSVKKIRLFNSEISLGGRKRYCVDSTICGVLFESDIVQNVSVIHLSAVGVHASAPPSSSNNNDDDDGGGGGGDSGSSSDLNNTFASVLAFANFSNKKYLTEGPDSYSLPREATDPENTRRLGTVDVYFSTVNFTGLSFSSSSSSSSQKPRRRRNLFSVVYFRGGVYFRSGDSRFSVSILSNDVVGSYLRNSDELQGNSSSSSSTRTDIGIVVSAGYRFEATYITSRSNKMEIQASTISQNVATVRVAFFLCQSPRSAFTSLDLVFQRMNVRILSSSSSSSSSSHPQSGNNDGNNNNNIEGDEDESIIAVMISNGTAPYEEFKSAAGRFMFERTPLMVNLVSQSIDVTTSSPTSSPTSSSSSSSPSKLKIFLASDPFFIRDNITLRSNSISCTSSSSSPSTSIKVEAYLLGISACIHSTHLGTLADGKLFELAPSLCFATIFNNKLQVSSSSSPTSSDVSAIRFFQSMNTTKKHPIPAVFQQIVDETRKVYRMSDPNINLGQKVLLLLENNQIFTSHRGSFFSVHLLRDRDSSPSSAPDNLPFELVWNNHTKVESNASGNSLSTGLGSSIFDAQQLENPQLQKSLFPNSDLEFGCNKFSPSAYRDFQRGLSKQLMRSELTCVPSVSPSRSFTKSPTRIPKVYTPSLSLSESKSQAGGGGGAGTQTLSETNPSVATLTLSAQDTATRQTENLTTHTESNTRVSPSDTAPTITETFYITPRFVVPTASAAAAAAQAVGAAVGAAGAVDAGVMGRTLAALSLMNCKSERSNPNVRDAGNLTGGSSELVSAYLIDPLPFPTSLFPGLKLGSSNYLSYVRGALFSYGILFVLCVVVALFLGQKTANKRLQVGQEYLKFQQKQEQLEEEEQREKEEELQRQQQLRPQTSSSSSSSSSSLYFSPLSSSSPTSRTTNSFNNNNNINNNNNNSNSNNNDMKKKKKKNKKNANRIADEFIVNNLICAPILDILTRAFSATVVSWGSLTGICLASSATTNSSNGTLLGDGIAFLLFALLVIFTCFYLIYSVIREDSPDPQPLVARTVLFFPEPASSPLQEKIRKFLCTETGLFWFAGKFAWQSPLKSQKNPALPAPPPVGPLAILGKILHSTFGPRLKSSGKEIDRRKIFLLSAFYPAFVLLMNTIACIIAGAAMQNPALCDAARIINFIISFLCLAAILVLRSFLVPGKTVLAILIELCSFVACTLSLPNVIKSENKEQGLMVAQILTAILTAFVGIGMLRRGVSASFRFLVGKMHRVSATSAKAFIKELGKKSQQELQEEEEEEEEDQEMKNKKKQNNNKKPKNKVLERKKKEKSEALSMLKSNSHLETLFSSSSSSSGSSSSFWPTALSPDDAAASSPTLAAAIPIPEQEQELLEYQQPVATSSSSSSSSPIAHRTFEWNNNNNNSNHFDTEMLLPTNNSSSPPKKQPQKTQQQQNRRNKNTNFDSRDI